MYIQVVAMESTRSVSISVTVHTCPSDYSPSAWTLGDEVLVKSRVAQHVLEDDGVAPRLKYSRWGAFRRPILLAA
jgi:hypothetical protein